MEATVEFGRQRRKEQNAIQGITFNSCERASGFRFERKACSNAAAVVGAFIETAGSGGTAIGAGDGGTSCLDCSFTGSSFPRALASSTFDAVVVVDPADANERLFSSRSFFLAAKGLVEAPFCGGEAVGAALLVKRRVETACMSPETDFGSTGGAADVEAPVLAGGSDGRGVGVEETRDVGEGGVEVERAARNRSVRESDGFGAETVPFE